MPSVAIEQRDGLRADALQAQQVEERGGNSASSSWWNGIAPVSTSSRIRPARSLPMPGSCAAVRPATSSVATALGVVRDRVGAVAVRADLERVLALDLEQVGDLGEHARDRGLSNACSPLASRSRYVEHDARPRAVGARAAPSTRVGVASGSRSRTGSRRRRRRTPWPPSRPAPRAPRDQVVDRRRRDARRQPLAVLPLAGDLRGRPRPSPRASSAVAHRDGGVADPLEAVERPRGRRRCGAW